MNKAIFAALIIASFAALPTSVGAAPIAGNLAISGRVVVDSDSMDWYFQGDPDDEFIVLSGTGYFDEPNLSPSTMGDAIDLTLDASHLPGPAGFAAPVDAFLTFDDNANLEFDLTGMSLCTAPFCAFGAGTPFNVIQTGTGTPDDPFSTTVTVAMRGTVTDTSGGDGVSNWTGLWTATFEGQSIADLIADLTDPNSPFIDAGYDAELNIRVVPQIPEPATMLTFGTGTALLAAAKRRRAKKNAATK